MNFVEVFFNIFLILLILCAVAAMLTPKLIDAVVIFGAFSFFSALVFTFLGALDVAFTEACIGAAITTVFFVSGIHQTQKPKEPS